MKDNLMSKFKKNHGFLGTKGLNSRNEWRELRKLEDNDSVIKIKKGLYRLNNGKMIDQRAEVAKIIPDGVFCMFTAWRHYNLSLYNPFEFYVAIRKKQKITLPAYPPVKLYYWIDKSYCLGITNIMLNNHPVKIYDLEKSACDAVRFRNKIGIDMMSEILKNYLKRQDKDLNRLSDYASQLRIGTVMQKFITVML
jgi:predicted transcriptional regulator of viral defense system